MPLISPVMPVPQVICDLLVIFPLVCCVGNAQKLSLASLSHSWLTVIGLHRKTACTRWQPTSPSGE